MYLLAAAAHGGEITVETRPFNLETTFEASALPEQGCVLMQLEPRLWMDFHIAEIAEHGRRVAAGELLVRFDSEAIDRQLAEIRRPAGAGAPDEPAHHHDAQTLAALEADRALCEMKAPGDGWFYHGPIENGRWTPGKATTLVKHGSPAVNRPFATFIPAAAKFVWVAFLDESSARALAPGCAGCALLAGREDLEIPVKLLQLASVPAPDGRYRADLAASWPAGFTPVAGSRAQIHLLAYQQPAAIVIPNNALAYGPLGWAVEVKLADGKTERRAVKRGRCSPEGTEIRAGLEVGQVVLTP